MNEATNSDPSASASLTALSDALVHTIERTAASVVRVSGRRGYALSGLVLDDDLVVTTSRAVSTEEAISVDAGDASASIEAERIGSDPLTDLALLRVPGLGRPAAQLEPASSARVGELVLRVARSSGSPEATLGLVRRVGGDWQSAWGARFPVAVHTDAAPFRGFSGGPLVRVTGEVYGMSTAALSRRRDDTIPSETITAVTDALREHGRVRRAYLGVSVQPVALPAHAAEASGRSRGLLVAGMEDDAPAAGSLALGDVLLSVDGEALARPGALVGLLAQHSAGTVVPIEVLRGGALQTVEVELGVRG